MSKKFTLSDITRQAVVAAIYIAVSLFPPFASIAYGPVQFRFAEILMVLPFLNKKYTVGLVVGCFITNIFSPMFLFDMAFGTLATLIACVIIIKVNQKYLISIIAAVVNGIIVGLELRFVLGLPLMFSALTVAAGELVVVSVGILLVVLAEKNKYIYTLLNK